MSPVGGTAGCVIASRLAEADPGLSILVIEGGPNNLDVPTIVHPALFLSALIPTSNATIFYKGNKESHINDRELIVPSGGTLGGGSSINIMMYSRAQRADFDRWNVPGWSAEDMIPYLKKVCGEGVDHDEVIKLTIRQLETYHGPGPKSVHGFDGPIHISRGTYSVEKAESDLIQAAGRVGYREIEDLSSLDADIGFQRSLRYIGPDGLRQDAVHRYLHPKIKSGKYPNLHVVVNSQVRRIVFDNKRASGVEYRPNPTIHPDAAYRTVRARKLVIISSGALGTPSVLERSGVGNAEILKKAGVDVIADLPGVGENYQYHHLLVYSYLSALHEDETMDALAGGRLDVGKLIDEKAPILGWNGMDVNFKIRPTDAEVASLGADFETAWAQEFKHHPTKPLVLGSPING